MSQDGVNGVFTPVEKIQSVLYQLKKTMVLQILAILVRVAADHLKKNTEDFCIRSRRKALKYDRKRFGVG